MFAYCHPLDGIDSAHPFFLELKVGSLGLYRGVHSIPKIQRQIIFIKQVQTQYKSKSVFEIDFRSC